MAILEIDRNPHQFILDTHCCVQWLLALVFVAISGRANPAVDTGYQVEFDPAGTLAVQACFAAGPALRLQIGTVDGVKQLFGPAGAMAKRGQLTLPTADTRRCIRYQVDLDAVDRYGDSESHWLLRADNWLYRPADANGMEVVVDYPVGSAVSLPWPRVARTERRARFRIDATPASWPNLHAFGALTQYDIDLPDGQWRVSVLPSRPAANQDQIRAWLNRTAQTLVSIYGRAPLPSNQVLVVPSGRGRGPVPWGQVNRGGGAAIHLVINQRKPYDELLADWTAAHEASHLLLPYLGVSGRWLSEGIASYYQNIARARTGDLTEREAFAKLHAGFERGRRGSRDGMTLAQANRRMRSDGKYMRVYWSGAAYWLQTDVALRSVGLSLDDVLSEFAVCHLPAAERWSPERLIAELDDIVAELIDDGRQRSGIFSSRYRRMLAERTFPDLTATYSELGLNSANGRALPDRQIDPLRSAMVTANDTDGALACR